MVRQVRFNRIEIMFGTRHDHLKKTLDRVGLRESDLGAGGRPPKHHRAGKRCSQQLGKFLNPALHKLERSLSSRLGEVSAVATRFGFLSGHVCIIDEIRS